MARQGSARHAWAVFLTAHAVLVGAVEARLAKAGLPPLAWYDLLWALERAGDGRRRMHELADLVVLSADPFEADPAALLHEIQVELTMVGGQIVYQR